MKHQNGMKTDKVVSFVTAITNYGKVLVVLLYLLQTTVKFWLFCCYICTLITVVLNFAIFLNIQQFFHNFVSFHPILMFLTILESGDKTKNIEDEFKTILLI